MGCIYSNFEGACTIADPSIDDNGCVENGYCVVEDDPDPSYSCENYETDDPDDNG